MINSKRRWKTVQIVGYLFAAVHLNIWFGHDKALDCMLMRALHYTYRAVLQNKMPARYFHAIKTGPVH